MKRLAMLEKGMKRTDVPMDGIHEVQASLEILDCLIDESDASSFVNLSCPFIRTILLGIMARLDAAIVEINES